MNLAVRSQYDISMSLQLFSVVRQLFVPPFVVFFYFILFYFIFLFFIFIFLFLIYLFKEHRS
jgi:hypothetical protein